MTLEEVLEAEHNGWLVEGDLGVCKIRSQVGNNLQLGIIRRSWNDDFEPRVLRPTLLPSLWSPAERGGRVMHIDEVMLA